MKFFFVSIGIFMMLGQGVFLAWSTPIPEPSVTESRVNVSNLPSFDLERVFSKPEESQPLRVGDSLILKLSHPKIPSVTNPAQELKIDTPSESSLEEEGWVVEPDPQVQKGTLDLLLKVSPLKAGTLTLPSLILKDSNDHVVARTLPYTVDVVSAIQSNDPKPSQLEDIAPPVMLGFPWWMILLCAALAIALVGVGIFLIVRWQKKKKPKEISLPRVIKTEDQVAWDQLIELERRNLISEGKYKLYYFTLSEILKTYVGARFHFDAKESTTRELFQMLETKQTLSDSLKNRFEQAFIKLDRVKFTDHIPPLDEPALLLEEAREFILATRRQLEISSTNGAPPNAVR